MARIQMFDTPHKALRKALGDLLNLAAVTNFTRTEEIQSLATEFNTVSSLIKSHSHHEDDICFADLDKIEPNATRHDRSEHIRLHHRLDDISATINRIVEDVRYGKNRVDAGRALYTDLCNLHAEMLVHMMEEERDTQPIFWKYMTDEQIGAFEPRILSSMTPEMSALWMRFIIPTQPGESLIKMFKGMLLNAPPFVFEANLRLAREVLSPTAYQRLESAFVPAFA